MAWFRFRQIVAKAMSTSTTATYCMAASQLIIEKDELKEVKKELQEIKEKQNKLLAHLEKTNAAKWYAAILPAPISLKNGHTCSAGIEEFIRHGAAHCRYLSIWNNNDGKKGNVGFPDNFFNDLIKHCYETEKPEEMIGYVAIEMDKPAPWPSLLVKLLGADFGWVSEEQLKAEGVPATLREENVEYSKGKMVVYKLRNKHKPKVTFKLSIWHSGDGACYKQMTSFNIRRNA